MRFVYFKFEIDLENKAESDGNVSDDEDDTVEYGVGGKIRPIDEANKKHVVHARSNNQIFMINILFKRALK